MDSCATHEVGHVLVHGVRWDPPYAEDQQTFDDGHLRCATGHGAEGQGNDMLARLLHNAAIVRIPPRASHNNSPKQEWADVIVVVGS